MKLEEENDTGEAESTNTITGDVIGNTAYSERFVLKILLKLANSDTLKEELKEKSFEDDLCTLWDMTSEKDVVLFLVKHDLFKLFCVAMPVFETQRAPERILEITIGIVANMCCQREGVVSFLNTELLLSLVFQYLSSPDTQILIQLLRLINSCLFLSNEDDLADFLNIFDNVKFPKCLYFILKNSTNKELLVTALENFNSLCSYYNVEEFRTRFYYVFVKREALDSVSAAFDELTVKQKDKCGKDETERILVISLQMAMNLVGFDKSPEIFSENRENIVGMIHQIISYYETKFIDEKEIDTELVDIIESINTVINMLDVSEISGPDQFFMPSYNIWKALVTITKEIKTIPEEEKTVAKEEKTIAKEEKTIAKEEKTIAKEEKTTAKEEKNKEPESEEEKTRKELKELSERLITPFNVLMVTYMAQCSDENLRKVLDKIGKDYEKIIEAIDEDELKDFMENRAAIYRTRLKDIVKA